MLELEKGHTADAADVFLHWQHSIKMDSKVFSQCFERNTVSANVCTLTVDRLKTRCRANRHNLSLICVQLKLVATHPEQNIISTCLNTGVNRKELIGWGTFGQLSVIGILVIVTIMDRNRIWQTLRVQGKQDRSQYGTLEHAVHKRVESRHSTINNDWLKMATLVGDKPVEDCTPNTKGCLKPFQQDQMVQRSSRATRETSLSSALPSRPSRTLNTTVSVLWFCLKLV